MGLRQAAAQIGVDDRGLGRGWRCAGAAVGAVLGAGVGAGAMMQWASILVAAMCILWGADIAASDIAARYISVRVNMSAFAAIAAVLIVDGAVSGAWRHLVEAVLAGVSWGVAMELVSIMRPGAVGGGDARAGAWVVMAVVWTLSLFNGFAMVGVAHLAAAAVGVLTRQSHVPFGAWLAASAATAALVGAAL